MLLFQCVSLKGGKKNGKVRMFYKAKQISHLKYREKSQKEHKMPRERKK